MCNDDETEAAAAAAVDDDVVRTAHSYRYGTTGRSHTAMACFRTHTYTNFLY